MLIGPFTYQQILRMTVCEPCDHGFFTDWMKATQAMACLGMITSVFAIVAWFAWLSGFAQPLTAKTLQLGTIGLCIAAGMA